MKPEIGFVLRHVANPALLRSGLDDRPTRHAASHEQGDGQRGRRRDRDRQDEAVYLIRQEVSSLAHPTSVADEWEVDVLPDYHQKLRRC